MSVWNRIGDVPLSPLTGEPLDAPSRSTPRRPRALSTSLAVHAGAILAILFLGPSLPTPPALPVNPDVPRLVFLIQPGPGGGGGGGGEKSVEPPSVRKIEGKDRARLAVEVAPRPKLDKVVKKEEPPREEDSVKAPVVAQAPNDVSEKGVLEGKEEPLPSAGSGGGGGAGSGTGTGTGEGRGSGIGPGWGGGFGGGAYQIGSGVTPPVVKHRVRPSYTEQALSHKTQGSVWLEVVIRRDGTVGEVRVLKGLRDGLDAKAVEAVKQWLFLPGRLKGEPVDVLAEVQVAFTLL